MEKISAPELIHSEHEISDFDCENQSLNEFLQKRALKNQTSLSKTYVVCNQKKVIAYFTLTVGSARREEVVKKLRRNAPEEIGFVLLARLAVDRNWKQQGIGKSLLREAILKTVQVSDIVGVRGLLVHALNEDAVKFYKKYDFLECPISDTLILPIEDIIDNFNHASK